MTDTDSAVADSAVIDALMLELSAEPAPLLPAPAERVRLREVLGWGKQQLAAYLVVKRETIWAWEKPDAPTPRGAKGQRYARLLEAARRYAERAVPVSTPPAPDPTVEDLLPALSPDAPPDGFTLAEPPELDDPPPTFTAAPPAGPVPFDDPDGYVVLPEGGTRRCVRCGRPTTFLFNGEPRHLYTAVSAAVAPPCWQSVAPTPAPAATPVPAADVAPAEPPRTPAPAADEPAAPAPARRVHARVCDDTFTDGPLAVLEAADGQLVAHLIDGRTLECRAKTVTALAAWTLDKTRIGTPKLHRHGFDTDPLIVLTAGAAEHFGLPAELDDQEELRLDKSHKVVKQITKAGWEVPYWGFGPWPRVFQRVEGGRRSVQFAVLPWNALERRVWENTAQLPAAEIARVLGLYAQRVITPRGTVGVNSLELMTALRNPTRAVKNEDTGEWESGPNPGALQRPVDPAPPEPPEEHPLVHQLYPHGRPEAETLDEEACQWVRPFDRVTAEERAMPMVVGLDLITAFLAAANNIRVGLGPAVYVENPRFDKEMPGSWWVDLSHIGVDERQPNPLDERLPNPFTPSGQRPTGPGWYATPTVAYAHELGFPVQPLKAYIRPDNGLYLTPWYEHLRDAYMVTMADLGVRGAPKGQILDERAFLEAMSRHKDGDPLLVALLAAIKATAKSGVGKLRERPQGSSYVEGEPWAALKRALWRPDIRAAVLSRARINMHRKMVKMAQHTGLYPLAVLTDCVVYASPGPSPLDILPHTADGKPAKSTFQLGPNPGSVKHQGTETMAWALEQLKEGTNIANYIGGGNSLLDGE